jgi:hypothetical protein
MWRYIITAKNGGYFFTGNHPERPAILVNWADAHEIADRMTRSTGRKFSVRRFSSKRLNKIGR